MKNFPYWFISMAADLWPAMALNLDTMAKAWQGKVSAEMKGGNLEPGAINAAVAAAMRDFPARRP